MDTPLYLFEYQLLANSYNFAEVAIAIFHYPEGHLLAIISSYMCLISSYYNSFESMDFVCL